MSARTQRFSRRIVIGAVAGFALVASACGAVTGTTTIGADGAPVSDSATATSTQSSATDTTAATGATSQSSTAASTSASADDALAALEALSDEEEELFLEAFEDAFNSGTTTSAGVDPAELEASIPEAGGAPDVTSAVPYGLCGRGWFVFDTLTWVDAVALLGFDPATYSGAPAASEFTYDGDRHDGGAALLNNELGRCGPGSLGEANITLTMNPYRVAPDPETWDHDQAPQGVELQFLTTQAGQRMVIHTDESNGLLETADLYLEWDWAGASDGIVTLQLGIANFYSGLTPENIQGLAALGELVSANVDFTPPVRTSFLPGWFACEGRNFVHADAREIADVIGFEGQAIAINEISPDWTSAECVLATVAADGDVDYAAGVYAATAKAYAPNSDDYEHDIESLQDDPSFTQGTVTIAGREMMTLSSPRQAIVVIDDGNAKVAVGVFPIAEAQEADTLAKVIEIVEIITR